MGGGVVKTIGTILVLIGIYLVLRNWRGTVGILQSIGETSLRGIAVLQGRDIEV